jgi:hypothetical protein
MWAVEMMCTGLVKFTIIGQLKTVVIGLSSIAFVGGIVPIVAPLFTERLGSKIGPRGFYIAQDQLIFILLLGHHITPVLRLLKHRHGKP